MGVASLKLICNTYAKFQNSVWCKCLIRVKAKLVNCCVDGN